MIATSFPENAASWYSAPLRRVVAVRPEEARALLVSFVTLFCLFTGYASLRPVRDSLGITLGTKQLGNLFGWTFVGMLSAMPIFGWLASRFTRRVFLPAVYCFFILNLLGFYVLFSRTPLLGAQLFYVWLSVVNLFVVSAFWSVMADLHNREQSSRLFGCIAAGSSAGSIVGPMLTALLVKRVGHADMILIAAGFWSVALILLVQLLRRAQPGPSAGRAASARKKTRRSAPPLADKVAADERPLGGNPWAGLALVVKSPYLQGISLFILFLSAATTFLYLQQATLLAKAFPDPTDRTRLLATLDTGVNVFALLLQLFVVGRLVVRVGVAYVLFSIPALMVVGFLCLALSKALAVFLAVMVVRRVGEYALLRPAREMLFTSVDRPTKYKAKSFLDTVVYRGADWLSAKLHELLVAMGMSASGVALSGAVVATMWAVLGFTLGRWHAAARDRFTD